MRRIDSPLFGMAVGSLGLKIIAAGLGFLNGIFLARLLGPAEYGVYSIIMAAVTMSATVAALGLPSLVTREVAIYQVRDDWALLKGIVIKTHQWILFSSIAVVCSVFLLTDGNFFSVSKGLLILFLLFMVPLMALNQLRSAILRGLHWVILADVPDLLLRPLVVLLLLTVSFSITDSTSAAQALAVQAIALGVALIVGTRMLASRLQMKGIMHQFNVREWFADALPFLGIALLGILEGQISLYLLGYLKGVEQVGLFQAANQVVGLISLGLVAVNVPLQPKLAAAWADNDRVEVQKLIIDAARLGTGLAVVGALILLPFAEQVLRLFGEQYIASANALRILVLGQLVNAAAGSCGIFLTMSGHQKIVMYGTLLALVINIVLAYISIPEYGFEGAALAGASAVILWNLLFAGIAFKKYGLNTTIFKRKTIP